MPRYFGSRLHLLSLFYGHKMHAEQFKAIIANLPLHQLRKFLCQRAVEDPTEVYGTLLWVPEESRLALLDCLSASLETPPLTPRSAPADAADAGGSSTLPAAGAAESGGPTLPHFGKDAALSTDDVTLQLPPVVEAEASPADPVDPPLQDALLLEGGNPYPAHLHKYHNHMGFSYDEWYDYWQRNCWWDAMQVPPGSTLPRGTSFAAPAATPAAPLDTPLDNTAGDGDGAPPAAPASSTLPSDAPGEAPAAAFESSFDDMPAGVYEKLGPYQVRRIVRVECQEECEECASGHCGAILDVSRPEKCVHKHRCKQCYRIFRAKQLQ